MSDSSPNPHAPPPAPPQAVLARRVRFSPDVLIQEIGGESVLLDLKSEAYFGLDPVGTRIMTLVNETNRVCEALDRVAEEFEVDRATLERDAIALLAECAAEGLVTIDDP